MMRYADPRVCPDCRSMLLLSPQSCPSCNLPLQGPVAVELVETLQHADTLLEQLRSEIPKPEPAVSVSHRQPAYQPVAAQQPAPHAGFSAVSVPTMPAYPPTAPSAPPRRTGIRTISVPTILLSLGALCLIVAGITFLAVEWADLDMGVRTAVLVGLTAATGALGGWLNERGLRVAAESLTTVTLVLIALDVTGAIGAGWLGSPAFEASVALVGTGVAVAAGLMVAARPRLITPELATPLGAWVAAAGTAVASGHDRLVAFGAVLLLIGAAVAGRAAGARILEVTANVAAATWWLWLLGAGFEDIALDPTLHSLWVDGNALPLLGAALLLMVPLAVLPGRAGIARVCLVGVATLVTLVVVAPAADESSNVIGVTALVALVAWTGAARVLPREWRLVAAGPLGLAALPAVGLCVILFTIAALRLGTVGQPFEHGVGVRLAEPDTAINPLLLVPLVVALLLAVWVLLPEFPVPILGLPLVVLAAFGTLVSYAVPLALPVAILALLAVVVATPVTHWGKDAGAATLSALAVACALPSAGLVAATCAVAIAVAVLLLRSATPLVGGAMLPAATAGLIWSGAEAADMAVDLRAVPILLVLGLLAIAMPRVEVEATAAVAGLLAAGASLADASDPSTALAIQLTLAGTLAIVSSLVHQDRRVLAWPGAALLVAAMFVPTAAVGATLLAGAVGVALAVLLLRSSDTRTTSLGGLLLPPASAALVWSGTEVANVAADQRAVPVLVVLGLLAIAMPRGEVEATAALAGLLAALASLDIASDQLTALAVDLTVAGALVTMSSLMHEDRRLLAWPGGAMLAAATWVRLYDLGVEAPEAYTLPSAVALIMVGIHRLWRTPGASTAALIPGLTLATVPSLLWVLVEPASGRAILLGLACLGLILVGTRFGWSAPLAVGSIVGGLLVIREVAPYTSELPQWVLIGLAGTILTVVGVTWESRLMELRRATAYLGRLR